MRLRMTVPCFALVGSSHEQEKKCYQPQQAAPLLQKVGGRKKIKYRFEENEDLENVMAENRKSSPSITLWLG